MCCDWKACCLFFPFREGVPLLLRDWLLEDASSVPSVFSCPGDSMTTPLCLQRDVPQHMFAGILKVAPRFLVSPLCVRLHKNESFHLWCRVRTTNSCKGCITLRTCTRGNNGVGTQGNRAALGVGTNKPGIECSFVVLWCRLRSAFRANCLLYPLILHGQMPVVTSFFFCAAFCFLDVVSFLSSGC